MNGITLRPLTAENWQACINLTLCPEQKRFVASNLYSVAEAQFYPEAHSLAVYSGEELVGYTLYGKEVQSGQWKIFRLMIDCAHQGKGYGESTLRSIIKQISETTDATEIGLSYRTGNEVACKLYKKLGFLAQHTDESGKVTAKLELSPSSYRSPSKGINERA